jgi:hypothetical protein
VFFWVKRKLEVLSTALSPPLCKTTYIQKQNCVPLSQYHVGKVKREAASHLNLKVEGEQFDDAIANIYDT